MLARDADPERRPGRCRCAPRPPPRSPGCRSRRTPSAAGRRAPRRCPSRGRPRPGTRSCRCSAPAPPRPGVGGAGPGRADRPRCCPSGTGCAAVRSATPCTASPSTGTSSRPPSRPLRSPAGSPRPDLLLVGALLHDIGKGWPGDHTEAGVAIVAGPRAAARLRRRRHRRPGRARRATICCCRDRHPARPRRPGDRRARSPRPSAPRTRSSCCTRSPRPTPSPPVPRPGATGGGRWSPTWSAAAAASPRRPARPADARRHAGAATGDAARGCAGDGGRRASRCTLDRARGRRAALRPSRRLRRRPAPACCAAAAGVLGAAPAPRCGPVDAVTGTPIGGGDAGGCRSGRCCAEFGDRAGRPSALREDLRGPWSGSLDVAARLAEREAAYRGAAAPRRAARRRASTVVAGRLRARRR